VATFGGVEGTRTGEAAFEGVATPSKVATFGGDLTGVIIRGGTSGGGLKGVEGIDTGVATRGVLTGVMVRGGGGGASGGAGIG
jgi:hypothetical protein